MAGRGPGCPSRRCSPSSESDRSRGPAGPPASSIRAVERSSTAKRRIGNQAGIGQGSARGAPRVTAAAATATVQTVRQRPPWAIPAIAIGLVVVYFFLLTFILGLNPQTAANAPQIAIQQVANALSIGAIYALIALGYTMVYGII